MTFKLILFSLLLSIHSLSAGDLKIGIIDEEKVIENYEKSGKLLETLEIQVRAKEAEIKALEESIRSSEREFMTAGSDKKEEILQKVTRNKIEIEVQRKLVKELFNGQRERYRVKVVDDIKMAIQVIGKEEGYDLVLRKEMPGPRGMEATVYFSKEGMDISQSVLDYLNAKFRQELNSKIEK